MFGLSKTRQDLQPHLFLCSGPICMEKSSERVMSNVLESGFLCTLLCTTSTKEMCFMNASCLPCFLVIHPFLVPSATFSLEEYR